MQPQAFNCQIFDDSERWFGPEQRHKHIPRPVKMIKEEETIQMQRVKKVFPDKTGTAQDNFFSSKILSKGLLGEPENSIINLGLLIDEVFNGGEYRVKNIDLNVGHGWLDGSYERTVYSDGPEITFYLKKGLLRGRFTARMPKTKRRYEKDEKRHEIKSPEEIEDEKLKFYGQRANIWKLGSKILYLIKPGLLQKRNTSTGKVEYGISSSYDIKTSQVVRSLTTHEALAYLTEELHLLA